MLTQPKIQFMRHSLLLLSIFSASLISPFMSMAQGQPVQGTNATKSESASLRATAQVEGITEFRLPNGLRVLLAPDASKPTTTVNITYLVGSRHENYGETGMAHLLEHLVFKGTPTPATSCRNWASAA